MSKTSRILLGAAATLLLVVLAGLFILRHLVTKSFPETTGTIALQGLHSTIDIYRDEYGVPHIHASDEHDLMFAAGYAHAQDRLWQMDLLRRTAQGRLSEVFGKSTVEYDKLFRTIGLGRLAAAITEHLHPDTRRILDDYCEGVNAFIDTHRGRYPIEFDMLNYEPEHWTPEHSVLVTRLMAWNLNLAWFTDITYGEIANRVPPEKLQQIIPGYPDSVRVTVPSTPGPRADAGLGGFAAAGMDYREFACLGALEAGSNAWAVDSSKSLSGKPVLANDPHLPVPQPSLWYEITLSAPGWNVGGVSLPGVPMIVIGHNEHLAWGLTNAMLDDADFYTERIDTTTPGRYFLDGTPRPMDIRIEKIFVHAADSVLLTIRSTHHGPVVSDIHPASADTADSVSWKKPPVTMRWTGFEMSDEIYGFYLMDRSTNPVEFEHGLSELTVPGQAVVYADAAGNIATWTAGRVPIRGKGNPILPFPGWTSESDWKGFVPFDRLPKSINPPEGFVACANQRIADKNYPYYLSTLWEPPSRILRIRELLRSTEKFTPDDFKQFQQDVVSLYARDIVPHLFAAYDSAHAPDRITSDALTYLRNWDYRFGTTDIATTIFNGFFIRLLRNTYEDEMGPDVFREFVAFGAIPYRVTGQLLAADSSSWFDDIGTPGVETKNDIVRKSFSEAIGEMQSVRGSEMKHWRWGSLHEVTFAHPFGGRKPLGSVFNIGPFPAPGGGTTVNKAEFRLAGQYTVTVGASMRQIVDLANPLSAFMVLTSGESGQPLQQHYSDQTTLWLNGGYHRVTIDWKEITGESWPHLQLKPQ